MSEIGDLRKRDMIARGLVVLAALAFVLAVLGDLGLGLGLGLETTPEGFSRASTNLALIGIAMSVCFKS